MAPYIPQERREDAYLRPATAGELNYCITRIMNYYLGCNHFQPSYVAYNEVMGVLECVKQEFYRRMVAPYEDKKCEENGDVFK